MGHNGHIDERRTPCGTNKPESILFREKENNQKYRCTTIAVPFRTRTTRIFSGQGTHIH